jgi:hypothetical protein
MLAVACRLSPPNGTRESERRASDGYSLGLLGSSANVRMAARSLASHCASFVRVRTIKFMRYLPDLVTLQPSIEASIIERLDRIAEVAIADASDVRGVTSALRISPFATVEVDCPHSRSLE